jgi:hypothetical protein
MFRRSRDTDLWIERADDNSGKQQAGLGIVTLNYPSVLESGKTKQ